MKTKALHIDSDSVYRTGLRPWLEGLDDETVLLEATSLREAASILEEEEALDLVLLDLATPECERLAGLEWLLGLVEHSPVVVLSQILDPREILKAIEIGASGYIPKRMPGAEIAAILSRVLDGLIWIPHKVLPKPEAMPEAPRPQVPVADRIESLSPRARQTLDLLVEGKTNKEIAMRLGISANTVKLQVFMLLKALGAENRVQAAVMARGVGQPRR